MTTLEVKKSKDNKLTISWKANHPKNKEIENWLAHLSPGYTEFLLKFGHDPHCENCRDAECPDIGSGNDACPAFKYGEVW